MVLYRNNFYTAPQALSFKSYLVLIKERDDDDHGDNDDHGLCLKTFSMNMYNISKSCTKTSIQSKNNIVRAGAAVKCQLLQLYISFFTQVCLAQLFHVLCRQKAKPYISFLKSWTTTKTAGSN